MNIHENYIQRCIDIGKNGLGTTAPNPMVGCVIVYKQKIIGEGFTSPYGGAHAEINAINSVENQSLLSESTLYVTLEPCSHYGKTPPCADAIIKFKIPKVVIGTIDTHSKVGGKGIQMLKEEGCEVIVGVLETKVKNHHKRFFMFHNKKRPYIILKWAQSSDGFLAPSFKNENKPVWITSQISRQLVHKWRAEEQAILVGTNTVIDDDPSLTVRNWYGKNPIRIILDRNSRLPKEATVFDTNAPTIIIKEHSNCPSIATHNYTEKFINWSKPIAHQISSLLFEQDINSVIIEGGRQTLQTFIDENLWDEARVFIGPTSFSSGTIAPHYLGSLQHEEHLLNDTLKIYVND